MKDLKDYEGRIVSIERMASSGNGNPRYLLELVTDDERGISFVTGVDSCIGYEIANREFHVNRVRIVVGRHYGRLTLAGIKVLAESGRVHNEFASA